MNLFAALPETERRIAENFDDLICDIQPLNAKQRSFLPQNIHKLSLQLTAERSSRKMGYMNNAAMLCAYAHYFMRWNLFRLTSLFTAMNKDAFVFLQDGSCCLDIGSGPLTLPIALYLARPELRTKKLTWYCMDTSHHALALGENLFLSCAARLQTEKSDNAWRIIRVKGEIGTRIRQKVSFISCANMFNEQYWNTHNPLEQEAKKYARLLLSYTVKDTKSETSPEAPKTACGKKERAADTPQPFSGSNVKSTDSGGKYAVFVVEPGIPRAARFVSLLRSALIRNTMHIVSPCTHEHTCPMDGKKGGKWCHFILNTETAPQNLQKLSEKAGLPKDRAALSFVFAVSAAAEKADKKYTEKKAAACTIRICSDPIALSGGKTGRYACAPWGLTLVTGMRNNTTASGDIICTASDERAIRELATDAKSGAKILNMYPPPNAADTAKTK